MGTDCGRFRHNGQADRSGIDYGILRPVRPQSSMSNRIKELREARGLSLEALGKLIGVERSTIWKLEMDRQKLTVDYLKKIAAALSVDVADVIAPKGSDLTA